MNNRVLLIVGVIIVAIIGGYFLMSGYNNQESAGNGNTTNSDTSGEAITIKGSDTSLQLVSNLVEEYRAEHSDVTISVEGGGSGTGIAALINKEIDVANSSRAMKDEEKTEAGESVKELIIGRDGLTVIVNPENPITKLTVEEIGAIYRGEIKNWKEIGGNDAPIVLYGRQTTSGTYEYFREEVVQADYSTEMRNMEGNQAIAEAVANDATGIGYVGLGYIMDEAGESRNDLTVLEVAADKNNEYYSPLDEAKVASGDYALTRPLYQYLEVPEAGSALEEFITFELSEAGGKVTESTGFLLPFAEDKTANAAAFPFLNE